MATANVVLETGPLLQFPVSMLDQLRKLGLVVEVEEGVIMLRQKYVASTVGASLTPEQAKILTHMDLKTVQFTIHLEAHWSEGNFEEL